MTRILTLVLFLAMTLQSSAQLISLDHRSETIREELAKALDSLSYNCQGYLGLYGDTGRNADHFFYIEPTEGGYRYLLEGHGIRKYKIVLPDKSLVITTVLNHNAIFNQTDKLHVEPQKTAKPRPPDEDG